MIHEYICKRFIKIRNDHEAFDRVVYLQIGFGKILKFSDGVIFICGISCSQQNDGIIGVALAINFVGHHFTQGTGCLRGIHRGAHRSAKVGPGFVVCRCLCEDKGL